MRICTDQSIRTEASVLVLGMFDGVHLGHQALMHAARALADEHGVPMVVMTFDRHPLSLIAPAMAPPMLTTPQERICLLEKQGADIVCVSPFTGETRDRSPEEFVRLMVERWHPVVVVIGYNYNFGRHGVGTRYHAGAGKAKRLCDRRRAGGPRGRQNGQLQPDPPASGRGKHGGGGEAAGIFAA